MIKNIFNNSIKFLLLNIIFHLNIKNKLLLNFKIFFSKFNLNEKIILKCIKNIKYNKIFNFRNKLNFNKSKCVSKINKHRPGKARLNSSSSNTLKGGLLWFGLRNLKLKKYKLNNDFLNYLIVYKKNVTFINTLELVKFLYDITFNNINLYDKILFTPNKNFIFINLLKNYIPLIEKTNISLVY